MTELASAQAIVVVTTVGEEERALSIAHELVARRLAACVNVVPGMRSIYRWQGKICRDSEYLLLIKALRQDFDAVAAAIRELHGYELPEILAFDVAQGDAGFLAWIRDAVDRTRAHPEDEESASEAEDLAAAIDRDDTL